MSSTQHDYFVSLDDDAWFLKGDEISVAIELLERSPRVAAVAFDIASPDRPAMTPRAEPRLAALFIGCGHVIRLAALRDVGTYEATPGMYGCEEKDLCLRLMDAGYAVVMIPGLHVWHDKTPIARVLPEQYLSGVCNDLVLTLRRTPATLLPGALLVKLFQHFRLARHQRLIGPCMRGVALFARSIPVVWSSRRPISTATLRAYMRLARS